MAYEVVMPYHLHMPSYFLGTFTEYPYLVNYSYSKTYFTTSSHVLFPPPPHPSSAQLPILGWRFGSPRLYS